MPLDALVISNENEADTVADDGNVLTWPVNVLLLMLRAEPSGLVNVSLIVSVEPCLTIIGCGVALYPSFVLDMLLSFFRWFFQDVQSCFDLS